MPDFDLFIADKPVTSMEGTAVSLSETDLRDIADGYDPALHEAPIIIGHPQHDAPAWGWISRLSFADGRLQADEKQVIPEFAQARSKGFYKKISARFYTPTAPNNPRPGHYYLRDVGFLGAMPPAVKGLRTFSFSDADADQVVTAEVSFADLPAYAGFTIASVFRRLRDWILAEKGQEVADQVLPDWQVESLREMSQRAAEPPESQTTGVQPLSSFADPAQSPKESTMTDAEKAEMEALKKQVADLSAEKQQQAAERAAAATKERRLAHASFAEELVKEGRWPAGSKDVLVATLDAVSTPDATGQSLSFGEGDGAQPLATALTAQLKALPVVVSFGEVATHGAAGGEQPSNRAVADRAGAWKRKQEAAGNSVSFADAVAAVNAGLDKE